MQKERGGKKPNPKDTPAATTTNQNQENNQQQQQQGGDQKTEKQPIQTKFFANEVTLFGKYKYDAEVSDISLTELIAVNNSRANVFIPHTAGRYQVKRFRKTTCPIIERLTNSLMMHGRNNGKKNLASNIVKQALEIIQLTTNKNPLETVLEAISKAGPREDSTKIGI